MAEPINHFVARRKPDWDALALSLRARASKSGVWAELERMDLLYRKATADLAHAQSFYPNTDVLRFLNQLCGEAYAFFYRPRGSRLEALKHFYSSELPRTVQRNLPFIGLSAGLLALGILLGSLAVATSPAGREPFIPSGIRESVASGQMWTQSLFAVMPTEVVTTQIATNNLSVTIAAFASGLLAGLGTVALLVFNGLHLGAIATFCARNNLGGKLAEFISAHGPVELSIIVLAGAAGLKLGQAIVRPGDESRAEALGRSGQEGVRILLGTAPFLGAIALVEGYLSPSPLLPPELKLVLGLTLAAGLWSYLLRTPTQPR